MHPAIQTALVCPVSKAPLTLSDDHSEMICEQSQLAYPIKNGIPVLLKDQARSLEAKSSQATEKPKEES